ncbi:MAG TPA: TolC family protein [Blastocatellia bacterium]|nr:TolC family protein [Blastocatellia bacterium]
MVSISAQVAAQEIAVNKTGNAPLPPVTSPARPESTLYLNPVEGMEAEDAVRYALASNKGLMADRRLIAEATGRLKQAGLKPNPMLEVAGSIDPKSPTENGFSVGVSLPLELGGRRARRIEVAQRELERVKYEVAERERKLAGEVRIKYGEALEAARNLELNERLLELNQQSYTLIKARVTEGASAPLEQSLLQVEVGRIEAQRATYASRTAVLIEELKNLMGMTSEERLQVRDEFIERPVAMTREQVLEQAMQSRPDLQAARAAEAVAAALIAQARTEGKADLSVFAEYGLQGDGFDQRGLNAAGQPERIFSRSGMVKSGVTITLPTRNKNQGNIEAAVAAAEEARLRREFVESVIRREVAAAYTRYEGAARVLKTYNTDLLAASQNNLRIVRGSYELGHVRLTEVLNEQRRLVDVQMSYTGALKEYYAARAELENVLGAPGGK